MALALKNMLGPYSPVCLCTLREWEVVGRETGKILVSSLSDGEGPIHHGVCSSWLNRIEKGEMVPCFVRR